MLRRPDVPAIPSHPSAGMRSRFAVSPAPTASREALSIRCQRGCALPWPWLLSIGGRSRSRMLGSRSFGDVGGSIGKANDPSLGWSIVIGLVIALPLVHVLQPERDG